MDMLRSCAHTVLFYIVLLVSMRLLGKRQIGQMEPSEFVVTMLVANLASIPMEDPNLTALHGLLPIAIVVAAELLLSWLCMGSIRLRRVLCGKPVILIENGRILQKNLRKNRITADELTGHLRLKEVLDLTTVQFAILETNGDLSVFLFPEKQPASAQASGIKAGAQNLPVTIIEHGRLLPRNLELAKKDERWLSRVLRKHRTTVGGTYLLTVDAADTIFWLAKEE
jgi:uncharacterized membrane protein YcaP (DUF421 family)